MEEGFFLYGISNINPEGSSTPAPFDKVKFNSHKHPDLLKGLAQAEIPAGHADITKISESIYHAWNPTLRSFFANIGRQKLKKSAAIHQRLPINVLNGRLSCDEKGPR